VVVFSLSYSCTNCYTLSLSSSCLSYFPGLLYGPANSFFYLAKDVESGLDWCEKQCKDNEDELCSERSTRQVAGMPPSTFPSSFPFPPFFPPFFSPCTLLLFFLIFSLPYYTHSIDQLFYEETLFKSISLGISHFSLPIVILF
jgi:hypothetical protein